MTRSNQETLGNGCVCETGCDSCDRLSMAYSQMRAALDIIANITEAPHWESKRRWDISRKARAALRLAEKVRT